jgi:hypothetical protein
METATKFACILLVSVMAGVLSLPLVSKPAKADVMYTFTGTVDSLTYNNITPGSIPIPFVLGEPVVAEIYVPDE